MMVYVIVAAKAGKTWHATGAENTEDGAVETVCGAHPRGTKLWKFMKFDEDKAITCKKCRQMLFGEKAPHRLYYEWSGEYGVESSTTGYCRCGWTESCSSRSVVLDEYYSHLKSGHTGSDEFVVEMIEKHESGEQVREDLK